MLVEHNGLTLASEHFPKLKYGSHSLKSMFHLHLTKSLKFHAPRSISCNANTHRHIPKVA